jgi:hypothetical protein
MLATPAHMLTKLHWELHQLRKSLTGKPEHIGYTHAPSYCAFNFAVTAWHLADWTWRAASVEERADILERLHITSSGRGIGIEHENIAPDHRIEGFSLLDRAQPGQAKGDVAVAELFDPIFRSGDGGRRAIDSYDEPIIADKLSNKKRCIAGPTPHVQDPHAFRNSSVAIELESERGHEFGLPSQALQLPVGVPQFVFMRSRLCPCTGHRPLLRSFDRDGGWRT